MQITLSCGHPADQASKNRIACKACAKSYYERWRRARGVIPREEWLASVRSAEWCPDCKQQKSLSQFNRARDRPSGYANICRPCARARNKAWRSTMLADPAKAAKWRARNNEASKKYRAEPKNDMKRAAHLMVAAAIKIGILTRQPCESCGVETVDAHHDDYTRPLDVRWLCRAHHKAAHHD